MRTKTDRYKWLTERRKGLGSSDAAAILGLSRFKTALHVVAEKLNDVEMEDERALLRLGLAMEPVILDLYEEKTGVKPRRVNRIMQSKEHPWQLASLDAEAGKPRHPLEIKNVIFPRGGDWGEEGTDSIPDEYVIQTQHQMSVTGADFVEVPVLMFAKLRIYIVRRNEELIREIIARESEFWQKHIIRKEPVTIDFEHPNTLALLQKMYKTVDPNSSIELSPTVASSAGMYFALAEKESEIKKRRATLKAELIAAMGSKQFGILPNGSYVERKEIVVDPYVKKIDGYSYVNLYLKNKSIKETA